MASPFTTVLLLLLPILLHHTATACHVHDHSALLSFKSGFKQDPSPSGLLSSWVPNTDCCHWEGVLCELSTLPNSTFLVTITGRVIQLVVNGQFNAHGTYLSGTLSTSLTKLRHLTDFALTNFPNITGPFPTFLSTLPNLQVLWIQNTKLSGPIPRDFGTRFAKLETVSLFGNQFTGTIPNSLSHITNLYYLNLGGNKLTGPIPPAIGQLRKLVYLNLEKNWLSGSPVKSLSQFTSLEEFLAYGNQLRFNMSDLVIPKTLKHFNLSRNLVYGKVPASIVRLEELDLSYNHLCGQLPKTKFSAKVFEGNDCLCGSPLPACKN